MLSVRENVRSLSDRHPLHRLTGSPAFGSALDTCCHSAAGPAQAPPRPAPAHVLSLLRQDTCAVTQPGPVPAEGAAPAARHCPPPATGPWTLRSSSPSGCWPR